MRVAVGSSNPVKRRAVEATLPGTGVPEEVTVRAIDVPSGVSEQPRSRSETIAGARNRARNAFESGQFDLGVGLEGGVASVIEGTTPYLVMWGAATDGERWGQAAGPSYPMPAVVADRVQNGAELGPVMDELLGESEIARENGAAGVFTGDRVDRETALSTAVAGAIGPFVVDLY